VQTIYEAMRPARDIMGPLVRGEPSRVVLRFVGVLWFVFRVLQLLPILIVYSHNNTRVALANP
jgi:hypothetical protein